MKYLVRMFTLIVSSIVSLILSVGAANALPHHVNHVEPLNWWVGMKHPELQIMLQGENIAELTPQLDYPGVSLVSVERTGNKNYLFVNLLIAENTKPGVINISLNLGDKYVTRIHYKIEARRAGSAERRSFDASDVIYLIVPDRFANANPGNDSNKNLIDKANRSIPLGRHGGDIKGMQNNLDYIANMGFTMIWPTPLLENNQQKRSYHGYALTDFYRIDSRFGSNEDFKNFVAAANKKNIGVIQDVVLNHVGSNHWWMKDLPALDWLNFQSGFVPTNNQHATVQDPHASTADKELFLNGWFVVNMPDLNQRNPLVARYLMQNSVWWIEYANLSGIREDTFSYADTTFLTQWCHYVLSEYPHLNIVGEEMNDNPHIVSYWQKGAKNNDNYDSGLPSLMDFPVTDLMPKVLHAKETDESGLIKLYEMIASDFVYANPMNLMVFPDNHDRARIFSVLHENIDLFKTSMLFTATTRGIPQFFYGTEVLATSPIIRDDGLLRLDMPGGWKGDTANAFTGKGLTAKQLDAQQYIKKLLNWQKHNSAIHTGKLMHYIPRDGLYVYFRYDQTKTVMVVINKNKNTTELALDRFSEMLKNKKSGKNIITDEMIDLSVPLKLTALTSVAIDLYD